MQAFPVIIDFNIPKNRSFRFLAGAEVLTVKPFLFELAPEAFHRRVIPAVALTAHRTLELIFFKHFLILNAAILAAPVAVKNHALWAASLFAGIFKASYYKLFCHPSVHRPADEFLAA